jgi:hypothetical protein
MNNSTYHILLRVSSLTLALVLLFDSGLLSPISKELSHNTQLYLANAVGVNATVSPTELNSLTAKITARERDLDSREAAISEREIEIGLSDGSSAVGDQFSTYLLSVILFILLVLIILNYTLDFARIRRLNYLN